MIVFLINQINEKLMSLYEVKSTLNEGKVT